MPSAWAPVGFRRVAARSTLFLATRPTALRGSNSRPSTAARVRLRERHVGAAKGPPQRRSMEKYMSLVHGHSSRMLRRRDPAARMPGQYARARFLRLSLRTLVTLG